MNMKEALNIALDFEEKGQSIYEEAAENSANPLTKKTFTYLAEQEKMHAESIREYIQENKLEELGSNPLEVKQFFTTTIDEFKEKTKLAKADVKAYETAMHLEKSAYDFYKEKHELAEDVKVKHFLHFMMMQENGHFMLLQKSLAFLTDPDSYHAESEEWLFEG